MGLTGNILVKSHIPKNKFDVFYIGKDYILIIQNMRKKSIWWVFQYNDCGKNLWKFLGTFLLVPYFQNMIDGCLSLGALPPISFWAQIHIHSWYCKLGKSLK